MNDRLQERLDAARWDLQFAQMALHVRRKYGGASCGPGTPDYLRAVQRFYAALDRAWEAQCMASASY
jgi:hypothetical protein